MCRSAWNHGLEHGLEKSYMHIQGVTLKQSTSRVRCVRFMRPLRLFHASVSCFMKPHMKQTPTRSSRSRRRVGSARILQYDHTRYPLCRPRCHVMRLESSITRRAALLTTSALLSLSPTQPALADPRQYIDPQGRFALEIPNGFAQSKRTATTGTIFVAGNFPRAATISVVAWPLQELVAEDVKATSLPGTGR